MNFKTFEFYVSNIYFFEVNYLKKRKVRGSWCPWFRETADFCICRVIETSSTHPLTCGESCCVLKSDPLDILRMFYHGPGQRKFAESPEALSRTFAITHKASGERLEFCACLKAAESSLDHTLLQTISFADETGRLYNHLCLTNFFPHFWFFLRDLPNQMSISKARGAEGHCQYEGEAAHYHSAGILLL